MTLVSAVDVIVDAVAFTHGTGLIEGVLLESEQFVADGPLDAGQITA